MMTLPLTLLLLFAASCSADIYLHHPKGNNDRNRERNENRNNGNRLFDSQNNDKGGYPWAGDREATCNCQGADNNDNDGNGNDAGNAVGAGAQALQNCMTNGQCTVRSDAGDTTMTSYYEGSVLEMSWAAQHACGPSTNTHCSMVLQYGCDRGVGDAAGQIDGNDAFLTSMYNLRDGYPTGGTTTVQNNNGNNPGNDNTNGQYNEEEFDQGAGNPGVAGTNRIAQDTQNNVQFGQHETYAFYANACQNKQRNQGLFVADQDLNNNDARSTRQNPNGNRNGLECPEERDYYPYWTPVPWADIAVLTSNTSWCPYYQENSQNVKAIGYCDCNGQGNCPITEQGCAGAGTWKTRQALTGAPPDCMLHAYSRDNHLGNAVPVAPEGDAEAFDAVANTALADAAYSWTLPNVVEGLDEMFCVFRLRYNMSSNDYPSMNGFNAEDGQMVTNADNCDEDNNGNGNAADAQAARQRYADCLAACEARGAAVGNTDTGYSGQSRLSRESNGNLPRDTDFDPLNNPCTCTLSLCAAGTLTEGTRPLYNRPYVAVLDEGEVAGVPNVGPGANDQDNDAAAPPGLSIASNTNQVGRTFQDRSYVFRIKKRTAELAGKTIRNIGVRGRRGNIVQTYPSVEYDFVPNDQLVSEDEMVHWQWTGSDYNVNRDANNAEGWRYSDRFNVVEFQEDDNSQFPTPMKDSTLFGPGNTASTYSFALGGQDQAVQGQGMNAVSSCKNYEANNPNENEEQNNVNNCGKLNAARAHFAKMMPAPLPGKTYHFGSTRNNNFSNRSQKSKISVQRSNTLESQLNALTAGEIAGIVIGSLVGLACLVGVAIAIRNKDGLKARYKGGAPPPMAAPPMYTTTGGGMQTGRM